MRLVSRILTSFLALASCLVVAAPSQAQGVRYEVTEQSSTSRVVGWERGLTQRDPNLANWHWEPITSSNHRFDVKRIQDPNQPAAAEPVAHYTKTPYVKPIHVALPNVVHTAANTNTRSDLNGKLLHNNAETAVTAQARPVATYKDYSHGEVGGSSNSAQTNLSGTIIHKSGRRTAYGEAPRYY
ncbi:MAG TPA: hypothetical protein V6C97_10535 [Oculatellaceae cyanobacterium]